MDDAKMDPCESTTNVMITARNKVKMRATVEDTPLISEA